MAAEHLRALIERAAPGRSVRAITRTAGISHHRLAYWLRPGVHPDSMPSTPAMREIATALECEFTDVFQAFVADLGLDLHQDILTTDERALLEDYRKLGPRDQATVRALLQHLHHSPPD